MITFHIFSQIKHLAESESLTAGQIAESLALDKKTVIKYLKMDQFEARREGPRKSVLDPHKPLIRQLLERHSYSAAQILRLIMAEGYTGGYTIVKAYVREIRPTRSKAYLTLAFAPGECAQVDWGSVGMIDVGNTRRRLSVFAMVLSYSRILYLHFTLSQAMEHFLDCHRRAFEFFDGVPEKVMVDNCKTAVLSHPLGGPAQLNPRYVDFAQHYDFKIVPCNVRAPHEKGRVENAIGYIKTSLVNGMERSNLEMVQIEGARWRDEVANVRIHGTTLKQPAELFKVEKPALQPLPLFPYDCGVSEPCQSNSQFRVRYDTNRYSVPADYASCRQLSLRRYVDRIVISFDGAAIADHARSYGRNDDIAHPDHEKSVLKYRSKARDQQMLRRFLSFGTIAETYHQGLHERRFNAMVHIRQILALADQYGQDNVVQAMENAAYHHAFSSDCITNLLEQRKRHPSVVGPLHLTRNADLLELEIDPPNFDQYQVDAEQEDENEHQ